MTTNRAKRRKAHRERQKRPSPYALSARLRVMAEYASSGIWAMRQTGPFRHAEVSFDALNLPDDLVERFERWIVWYEQNVEIFVQSQSENYGQKALPPFDYAGFNEEGRSLARALKAFVGPDAYVEYQVETEEGGVGASEEIP